MPTIFDLIIFIVVSFLSWKLSTGAITMPFTPEQRIEIENALEHVETLALRCFHLVFDFIQLSIAVVHFHLDNFAAFV